MNKIAAFIKENRRAAGLTQEEFAARSGLGLRFVRGTGAGKRNGSDGQGQRRSCHVRYGSRPRQKG